LIAQGYAITKSAVSQHVSTLERELGVQPLHRSTRRLAVTEAGSTLLQEGRALLEQARQLSVRASRQAAQLTGALRVTSPEA
jgi:LysR family transcriptional regulator, transcriptional activator for aaeXAB operon